MSFFLLTYDRREHQLATIERFEDQGQAQEARLQAELEALDAGEDLEIVVLEAESEEVLRLTHGSYFGEYAEAV